MSKVGMSFVAAVMLLSEPGTDTGVADSAA